MEETELDVAGPASFSFLSQQDSQAATTELPKLHSLQVRPVTSQHAHQLLDLSNGENWLVLESEHMAGEYGNANTAASFSNPRIENTQTNDGKMPESAPCDTAFLTIDVDGSLASIKDMRESVDEHNGIRVLISKHGTIESTMELLTRRRLVHLHHKDKIVLRNQQSESLILEYRHEPFQISTIVADASDLLLHNNPTNSLSQDNHGLSESPQQCKDVNTATLAADNLITQPDFQNVQLVDEDEMEIQRSDERPQAQAFFDNAQHEVDLHSSDDETIDPDDMPPTSNNNQYLFKKDMISHLSPPYDSVAETHPDNLARLNGQDQSTPTEPLVQDLASSSDQDQIRSQSNKLPHEDEWDTARKLAYRASEAVHDDECSGLSPAQSTGQAATAKPTTEIVESRHSNFHFDYEQTEVEEPEISQAGDQESERSENKHENQPTHDHLAIGSGSSPPVPQTDQSSTLSSPEARLVSSTFKHSDANKKRNNALEGTERLPRSSNSKIRTSPHSANVQSSSNKTAKTDHQSAADSAKATTESETDEDSKRTTPGKSGKRKMASQLDEKDPLRLSSTASTGRKKTRNSPQGQGISTRLSSKFAEINEVRILATKIRLTSQDMLLIKKIPNARLVEETEDAHTATHVIASDGKQQLKRTPKLMIALNKTPNIVELKWLKDSAKAGSVLSADKYVVSDKAAEKEYGFSMKETIARIRQRLETNDPVLNGKLVFVCKGVAGNNAPKEIELRCIIEAAGGQWLSQLKKRSEGDEMDRLVIITSSDAKAAGNQVQKKDVADAIQHGAQYKSTLWLFDGMMRQKLDLDDE